MEATLASSVDQFSPCWSEHWGGGGARERERDGLKSESWGGGGGEEECMCDELRPNLSELQRSEEKTGFRTELNSHLS